MAYGMNVAPAPQVGIHEISSDNSYGDHANLMLEFIANHHITPAGLGLGRVYTLNCVSNIPRKSKCYIDHPKNVLCLVLACQGICVYFVYVKGILVYPHVLFVMDILN